MKLIAILVLVGGGAFWALHDYRLPLAASAREANAGRTWEFKDRTDAMGVEQVWVPPGCFEMGSDPLSEWRAKANETPRHTVCIEAGFWMDRFEVTNENFERFVSAGGYADPKYWSKEGLEYKKIRPEPIREIKGFDGPRQPRVKLNWWEAEAYAAWRSGRLPTEAEWEWAARGPESRRYPWGDEFKPAAANTNEPDLRRTKPVGSYPGGRSWCGVYDLAGNVWEWTADGYVDGAYRSASRSNPMTPSTGLYRIIRGGAWGGIPGGSEGDARGARRAGYPVELSKNSHGFRIVSGQ